MCLSAYGWGFINIVNMRRKNPFWSGNDSYEDFKMLMIVTPIIFMLSGILVFRQKHDLSSYCTSSSINHFDGLKTIFLKSSGEKTYTDYSALQIVLKSDDDMMLLLHSL